MATRIPALVEPPMLVWARVSASISQEEAAKKLGIDLNRLEAWETGQESLSIAQLKKLAELYKRPLSVFFLSKPPVEFQPMRDLRRLHAIAAPMGKALAYEIRAAHERRLIAIELSSELGEEPHQLGITAQKTDDPEVVAERLRERLGISVQQQFGWRNYDAAFKGWREAIELAGVLVCTLSGSNHQVPLSEARGFAIAEQPFPTIAVNGQDKGYGRIFTMLHELGHIVLGESVFEDDFEPLTTLRPANRSTETFCNRVAAAVLIPRHSLLNEAIVKNKNANSVYSDNEISHLAFQYSVSREALLIRLSEIGRVNDSFVQLKRVEIAELYANQQRAESKKAGSDGFAPYQYQVLSHLGREFSRLVLEAYNTRRLTLSAASGYLGAQAKLVPKIELATYKRAAAE